MPQTGRRPRRGARSEERSRLVWRASTRARTKGFGQRCRWGPQTGLPRTAVQTVRLNARESGRSYASERPRTVRGLSFWALALSPVLGEHRPALVVAPAAVDL